jgi:hypothetical protein
MQDLFLTYRFSGKLRIKILGEKHSGTLVFTKTKATESKIIFDSQEKIIDLRSKLDNWS